LPLFYPEVILLELLLLGLISLPHYHKLNSAVLVPEPLFTELVIKDANKDWAVSCDGKPYVCTQQLDGMTTTYTEKPKGKELVEVCLPLQGCQYTYIDRPSRRTRDLNIPKYDPFDINNWDHEARVDVANDPKSDKFSVDYSKYMFEHYVKAGESCQKEKKIKGWEKSFMWLARVGPDGRIKRTLKTAKTQYAECIDLRLKKGKYKLPPPWKAYGYPIRIDWKGDQ
jgi:hypothetical protein